MSNQNHSTKQPRMQTPPHSKVPEKPYRLCVQCRLVWVEYRTAVCPDCIQTIQREAHELKARKVVAA